MSESKRVKDPFVRARPQADHKRPQVHDFEKAYQKTFERALNLLAYRARTVTELHTRLLEKEWTSLEIVNAVITALKTQGYLNDERFAHDFAAAKIRQKPIGRRLLKQRLAQKQINTPTAERAIEQAFTETPEEEVLERAISRYLRLKGPPTTREATQKLYDHLIRRGFSYALVSQHLRKIASRDEEAFFKQGEE